MDFGFMSVLPVCSTATYSFELGVSYSVVFASCRALPNLDHMACMASIVSSDFLQTLHPIS